MQPAAHTQISTKEESLWVNPKMFQKNHTVRFCTLKIHKPLHSRGFVFVILM
jgi:hypothetical protein